MLTRFLRVGHGPDAHIDPTIAGNVFFAGEPAPFTAEIASGKQMQSEHTLSDDMPVDTNGNAALARLQNATLAAFGAATAGNTDRREKLADAGTGIFKPT